MCNCSALNQTSDSNTYQQNENCTYDISQTQLEFCCYLTQHLEVEGRIIVCLAGLVFNSYALLLFFDKKLLSEIFNRLILCLVIMDNIYLLIGVFEVWFYNLVQPSFTNFGTYFFFVYPFRGIMLCCIIYMTVTLAFQRYKSIAKPMDNAMKNPILHGISWINVSKYVLPVLFFSVLYKLPLFFEVEPENYISGNNKPSNKTSIGITEEWNNGTHDIVSTLVISYMRENHLYVSFYMNAANLVVTGIIPVVVLIYFNLKVIQEMRAFAKRRQTRRRSSIHINEHQQAKEKRNKRTQTFILYAVVVNFFMCHVLRIVLNVVEMVIHESSFEDFDVNCHYRHPYWFHISLPISEILLKLNSSVNLFIYCAFNRNFRGLIKNHISYIGHLCGTLKCVNNSRDINNSRLVNTETIAICKTKLHSPRSPNDFTTETKTSPLNEFRLVPIDKRSLNSSCKSSYNSILVASDKE